jgi:hypothetical protein
VAGASARPDRSNTCEASGMLAGGFRWPVSINIVDMPKPAILLGITRDKVKLNDLQMGGGSGRRGSCGRRVQSTASYFPMTLGG